MLACPTIKKSENYPMIKFREVEIVKEVKRSDGW
jgi:hypothetical protein